MGKKYFSVAYQIDAGDSPSVNIARSDSKEQVEAYYREYYQGRYCRLNYINVCEIPEYRFEEYKAKPGMPVVEV